MTHIGCHNAPYQIQRLGIMVSDKKICLCKICDPQGGAIIGPWAHAHNLKKLGRGSLGNATYHISRLCALWFQIRRFFYVFPVLAYVNYVTPGA